MKRVFIENANRFDRSRMDTLSKLFGQDYRKFDKIVLNAALDTKRTLEAIKKADEIYIDSALVYNIVEGDASTLFNGMMYHAINEKMENKKVFIFRTYDHICWDGLKADLVDKAFRKNYLYVMAENDDDVTHNSQWEQVDIDKLIKEKL